MRKKGFTILERVIMLVPQFSEVLRRLRNQVELRG